MNTVSNISDSFLKLVPDSFTELHEFFAKFTKLSADVMAQSIIDAYDINYILNADLGSINIVNFLARRYDIPFPSDYSIDKQRLILKYYPSFIKTRGTDVVIQILDFIGRSEEDFYQSGASDYEVTQVYEGLLEIRTTNEEDRQRISKFKNLAQILINRLLPAGMYGKLLVSEGD